MYLFIYLSIFLKKAIWFLPSLSFLKRWCVFLPSMRTVQLFCVLFSPCVYSRPSTVTYLIFVTVTKVITYSIDVYIQHIIWKQCERRDSLCCTSLSLDRLFHGFFFLCCFDSCIGIQGCKLDVKKQMWQVNVIYSNKFQEIVTAVTFWNFFLGLHKSSQTILQEGNEVSDDNFTSKLTLRLILINILKIMTKSLAS